MDAEYDDVETKNNIITKNNFFIIIDYILLPFIKK
tara:strand:- start:207 stop:311 length:105 start_codon:yes stop_codon:yes gene_type:complete